MARAALALSLTFETLAACNRAVEKQAGNRVVQAVDTCFPCPPDSATLARYSPLALAVFPSAL